jgi:hypothetical protein
LVETFNVVSIGSSKVGAIRIKNFRAITDDNEVPVFITENDLHTITGNNFRSKRSYEVADGGMEL